MTPVDFLDLVSQHKEVVLFLCAILICTYLLMYRLGISSVADPLFIGVLASAFSAAVIAILIYLEEIKLSYLASFLATEIAFLIATLWGGAKHLKLRRLIPDSVENSWYLIFHYLLVAAFLISASSYLLNVGLPVLQATSRLITFQELGMLTWVLDVTWVGVPLSVLIKRHFLNKKSVFDYFLLILSFFLFATKGGKSDIVYILFVLHIFSQVTGSTSVKRVESALLIALPVLLVLITSVVLATWGVEASALQVVLERFLLFGDVFFMGYNDSFLATVPDIGFFSYFFGGTKSAIAAIFGNAEGERFILGYAISAFYYGSGEGIGPNARHNILGLVLWGPIFAVAFSALCGATFRACRRYVPGGGRNLFSIFLYCIVNVYAWFFFIDPSLALGYLLKIVIVVPPLAGCAYLLRSWSVLGSHSVGKGIKL
jgi:hypothetical protein